MDSNGVATTYTYDNHSHVTKVSASDGSLVMETSSVYDSNGRYLLSETDTLGNTAQYAYNTNTGTMKTYTAPKGQVTNYGYNDNGTAASLAAMVNSTENKNTLSYENGMTKKFTHNDFDYTFTYNTKGDVSKITAGDKTLYEKNISYSPTGNMVNWLVYEGAVGSTNIHVEETKHYDRYGKLTNRHKLMVMGEQYTIYDTDYIYGDITSDNDSVPSSNSSATSSQGKLRKRVTTSETSSQVLDKTLIYSYNKDTSLREIAIGDDVTVNYTYDNDHRLLGETYTIPNYTLASNYTYEYGDAFGKDIVKSSTTTVDSKTYSDTDTYDKFNRLQTRTGTRNGITVTETYGYKSPASGKTSPFVSTISRAFPDGTHTESISYDANGNISQIGNVKYTYDGVNRLTREENPSLNKRYDYTYDAGGNITSKKEYNYTTGALLNTYTYGYASSGCKDLLTSFNGQTIAYDDHGRTTSYLGNVVQWDFNHRIALIGGTSFAYDPEGIRQQKVSGNVTTNYVYNGTHLIYETRGSNTIVYLYDHTGMIGFVYNGTHYYYRKNILGDIVAIYNGGSCVATYTYDAWGNCTIGTNVGGIATINPIRYRGYYYDTETNLYYLQTRFYDPMTGRFISPDTPDYLDPESINGLNIYAYGLNNPVMYVDPTGHWVQSILNIIERLAIFFKELNASFAKYGDKLFIPWKKGGKKLGISKKSYNKVNGRALQEGAALAKTWGKVSEVVSYVALGAEIITSIAGNIQNEESVQTIVNDTIDIIVSFAVSAVVTHIVGTYLIPIPFLGAFVGSVIAAGINESVEAIGGYSELLASGPSTIGFLTYS